MDNKTVWGSSKETFGGGIHKEIETNKNEEVPASITQASVEPTPTPTPEPINEPVPVKRQHSVIFENPYLRVKSSGRFIYAERKGVDSVAFIFLATNTSDEKRVGLIHEFKPPIDMFLTTAFGGSLDKEEYKTNLKKAVVDEAIEEAGFVVQEDNVKYHGKVLVSTQMNQFCHLFSVDVDKMTQGRRTTTDPLKLRSTIIWATIPEALKLEDWKVVTIITKRLVEKDAYAVVRTS